MIRALIVVLTGLVLTGTGFLLSPWPWAALVVPGAAVAALGVFALFRLEVDE